MLRYPRAGLLAAGGVLTGSFVWLRATGDLGEDVPGLWLALLPAAAAWAYAAWLVLRSPCEAPGTAAVVAGFAVIFRLLLLDTPPSLSDDIYRYLWDARVQAAGGNPYAQAPDDPSLAPLRDTDWGRINHPELVTIYPPVAQWLFRGAHAAWPGATGLKAALVLCDLLLMAVLWCLLKHRGQSPPRILLYAWHPLPVIEIAGNGHVDVLAVTLMMMGLLFLASGRRHGAALALTAAILSKVVPVLCLAACWRSWAPADSRGWRRWLDPIPRRPLVWVPLGLAAAWLAYADAGGAMWSGLRTFAEKWRHNDSLYGLVYSLLADPKPGWEWDDGALMTARWICLAALAAVTAWAAAGWRDPVRAVAASMGALLLLSPVVHPWYLLWILAFLPMHPALPWMAFSWLAFLGYEALMPYRGTGTWQSSEWVAWVEYGPVYLLLGWCLVRWAAARRGAVSGETVSDRA